MQFEWLFFFNNFCRYDMAVHIIAKLTNMHVCSKVIIIAEGTKEDMNLVFLQKGCFRM